MPAIDVVIEAPISTSIRARQLQSAFDVPPRQTEKLEWHGQLPIDERKWNIGLIVGPSGCGKSTILNRTFGPPKSFTWNGASVVDDFPADKKLEEIVDACQAVGFNTIPSWLRRYDVLSNGEKFRVTLARAMLDTAEIIVIDEFTSVVDRRVAQIGSHAVQRMVRKNDRQLIAASCHYDVIEWLQPDWVLSPADMTFAWRSLQRRPSIECSIRRVPHSTWKLFSRFHYLTADLHKGAACFCLLVGDAPAVFGGVLHRPHPRVMNVKGLSRLVTLPDFQGIGLAFVFVDRIASAYKTLGKRFHTYPAHPALIRSFDASPKWAMRKKPGQFSAADFRTPQGSQAGGRPCAVFEWVGEVMDVDVARALIDGAA